MFGPIQFEIISILVAVCHVIWQGSRSGQTDTITSRKDSKILIIDSRLRFLIHEKSNVLPMYSDVLHIYQKLAVL